jgi:hypothetical protein
MLAEDATDDHMHNMPCGVLQELLLSTGLLRDMEAGAHEGSWGLGECGAHGDEQHLHDPAKDDLLRGHVGDLEAAVSNLET